MPFKFECSCHVFLNYLSYILLIPEKKERFYRIMEFGTTNANIMTEVLSMD